MAKINSYPQVIPTNDDLILGTDVNQADRPTKNFKVSDLIALVTGGATGLGAVISLNSSAKDPITPFNNQSATDFLNISGTGTVTFTSLTDGVFNTTGGATTTTTLTTTGNITSNAIVQAATFQTTAGVATWTTTVLAGFTSITTDALIINGAVSGTSLIIATSLAGASNTNIASTLAIKTYVDDKVANLDTLSELLAKNPSPAANPSNTTGGTDILVSTDDDITFADDSKILMGVSNDLQIYHGTLAGSNQSWIRDIGTNDLILDTNGTQIALISDGVVNNGKMGLFKKDGAVELYYDNNLKFETLSGGAKVTGTFEATGSGTFVNLLNSGTYSDSSGDVGTNGQLLSSTGTGTNWVTEVPLYNWSLEGTAIPSGTAVTVTDGTNITTTWDAANFDLEIATTGVPDGSGAANQVTFWSDTDTLNGTAGFTFAGGATGKVAIAGELEVGGVLTDGTFTGSSGAYTSYESIATTIDGSAGNARGFFGPLRANASSTNYAAGVADKAVELVDIGRASVANDIQLYPTFSLSTNEVVGANATAIVLASIPINNQTPIIGQVLTGTNVVANTEITNVQVGTPTNKVTITVDKQQTAGIAVSTALTFTTSAPIYTSGGNATIPTFLPNTVATSKLLTGLSTGVSSSILSSDTILTGMEKLQAQISATTGLAYEGLWDAKDSSEGGSSDGGNPDLRQPAKKVNGHFYIVNNAGSAEPNGPSGTQLSPWNDGDWCIYVSNGTSTDEWQKLDQSNEITGGGGSAGDMAMFTSAQNIAPSVINQTGTAGSFAVSLGSNADLEVTGDTQLGDSDSDTTLVKGTLTAEKDVIIKEGLNVPLGAGSSYGLAGQALFSGNAADASVSSNANVWTDVKWVISDASTTSNVSNGETVTFAKNNGLTVDESSKTLTYGIDYLGADNAILSATDLASGTIALTDQIWFNDINTGSLTNTLSYAPVSKLKDIINTYSWKLDVNGGTPVTIADTNQVGFDNGAGIVQSLSTRDVTTALRYEDSDNSGTIKNFIESAATVAPTAGDFLIFGDQAGASAKNAVKKATISSIVALGDQNLTQVLDKGNTSGTNDIVMADDQKVTFGTVPDLQIYHDTTGGNSHIQTTSGSAGDLLIESQGTGHDLYLRATDDIYIQPQGSENGIKVIGDGAVELYHNSLEKLATTSTGVSVTGDATIGTGINLESGTLVVKNATGDSSGLKIFQDTSDASKIHNNYAGTLQLGVNNTTTLTLGSSLSATFAGNVEIDGNLTVNGAIIHGGGSSASGKGGTFTGSRSVSQGANMAPLFSIKRPVTGSIIVQVMLTSGSSAAVSSSKAYTVAMQHSTTPVYNKLIDTGPKGTNDFDIQWTGGTTNTDTTNAPSSTDTISFSSSGPSFDNVNGTAVSGTGIPAGTVITDTKVGSGTVVLSNTVNISSGATITFDNSDILICRVDANTTNQTISYTAILGFDEETIATVKTATTV